MLFSYEFLQNEYESQFLWQCTSTDVLLVCIVSNFLKTPKYGFNGVFMDCTEDVVCTEYFANTFTLFLKQVDPAFLWELIIYGCVHPWFMAYCRGWRLFPLSENVSTARILRPRKRPWNFKLTKALRKYITRVLLLKRSRCFLHSNHIGAYHTHFSC